MGQKIWWSPIVKYYNAEIIFEQEWICCLQCLQFRYVKISVPLPGGSVVSVSDSWPGGCESNNPVEMNYLSREFSPLTSAEALRNVVGGFGRKSWPGGCEFDPRLRRLFFPAYFRLSPLQKHVRKVVSGFGKRSNVNTGVRKPGNTCASPTAILWPLLLKWR